MHFTLRFAKPLAIGVTALAALAACCYCPSDAASPANSVPVSVATLLNSETDISALPDLHNWTSNLQSSYDRTGGNGDSGHFLSGDGTEGVMADMDGPGAIVRIWSANPNGTIKIYIDGAATPVIEQPFHILFNAASSPFTSPLSTTSSGGSYTYLPIPYAHHCKVILDGGKGVYYHVNYLTFPAGTPVTSFSLPLSASDQSALDAAGTTWRALASPETASTKLDTAKTVQPGKTLTLGSYHGPAVIQEVSLSLPGATDADLRNLVLRAYFDGHATPDIEAPAADFFGNAFGRKPFHTSLLGSTADGTGVADFPMPFGRSARFTLENRAAKPISAIWGVKVKNAPFHAQAEGYFHALWTQEITTAGKPHVWAHVENQRGRFVGVVQSMQWKIGITYLEGDDQFRVDSQTWIPCKQEGTVIGPWNGTGTEDCFNSGWYFGGGPNSLPVNALLVKDGHEGQIDCMRWFFNDAPTFQSSLDGQIEHGGENNSPGAYYSSVAYWYSTGATQPWFRIPAASPLSLPTPAPPAFYVPHAIEGESLNSTAKVTDGTVGGQNMQQFNGLWSNDAQLYWRGGKTGDTLTLTLTGRSPGMHELVGYFTKASNYGQVSFQLNGQPLSATFDGYAPSVINSGPVDLGSVTLPDKPSTLVVTITGKNASASDTMFGLDALAFNPPGSTPVAIPGN